MGPHALDWQNLFGPTTNLDKICLCQIFNLSSVGALRHARIFINHKCQSHGNKHHRVHAVRGPGKATWDLRSPLRSNMLPQHIIACIIVFLLIEFVQLQQRQLLILPVESSPFTSGGLPCSTSNGSRVPIFTVWLPRKYEMILAGFGLKYEIK